MVELLKVIPVAVKLVRSLLVERIDDPVRLAGLKISACDPLLVGAVPVQFAPVLQRAGAGPVLPVQVAWPNAGEKDAEGTSPARARKARRRMWGFPMIASLIWRCEGQSGPHSPLCGSESDDARSAQKTVRTTLFTTSVHGGGSLMCPRVTAFQNAAWV